MTKVAEEQPLPIWTDLRRENTANHLRQRPGGAGLQVQSVEIKNTILIGDIQEGFVFREEQGPQFIVWCFSETGLGVALEVFEDQIVLVLILSGENKETSI